MQIDSLNGNRLAFLAIISQGHGDPSPVLRISEKLLEFGKVGGNHGKGNRLEMPKNPKKGNCKGSMKGRML